MLLPKRKHVSLTQPPLPPCLPSSVYEDGRVCISILHPPGEDRFNSQESADERWRPILGVEAIIVSVISMLSDPNDESPANIDAAVRPSLPPSQAVSSRPAWPSPTIFPTCPLP